MLVCYMQLMLFEVAQTVGVSTYLVCNVMINPLFVMKPSMMKPPLQFKQQQACGSKFHWSGFLNACIRHTMKLGGLGGGVGGHAPPGKFYKILCSEMASESIFGPKTRSLCFSLYMVTVFWFASRPHAWRLVSIGIGSFRHSQTLALHLVWILFQAMPGKNVWPPCSKSQDSAVLFMLGP